MIKIESTSAATCRTNGIKVGTRLISSTSYGQTEIEITWIGSEDIDAAVISNVHASRPTVQTGPREAEAFDLQKWRNWEVLA